MTNTFYNIKKGEKFMLNNIKVYNTTTTMINKKYDGFFILNFWEPFDYEDIEYFPVTFVECDDEKQIYEIKKNNIILGKVDDICSI